ncbi:MAG: hypothetical protein JW810_07175 [Sedimentisphaerales bacterium]|nr:hypothetical protein [Sedimentisphaerales bacterium]
MLLAEIEYNGQLSAAAYTILTGMVLLILGGLSWCFYRALKATNSSGDEQLPDDE